MHALACERTHLLPEVEPPGDVGVGVVLLVGALVELRLDALRLDGELSRNCDGAEDLVDYLTAREVNRNNDLLLKFVQGAAKRVIVLECPRDLVYGKRRGQMCCVCCHEMSCVCEATRCGGIFQLRRGVRLCSCQKPFN